MERKGREFPLFLHYLADFRKPRKLELNSMEANSRNSHPLLYIMMHKNDNIWDTGVDRPPVRYGRSNILGNPLSLEWCPLIGSSVIGSGECYMAIMAINPNNRNSCVICCFIWTCLSPNNKKFISKNDQL